MRIVNIIDSARAKNMNIWVPVVCTAQRLKDFGCTSEVWYPITEQPMRNEYVETVAIDSQRKDYLEKLVSARGLSNRDTLIVTHGSWRFPSFWGMQLKKMGFKWIYVPHGMLNHWNLRQKQFKKKIYLKFIESPIVAQADVIRAVNYNELLDLNQLFPEHKGITFIPSGIALRQPDLSRKSSERRGVFYEGKVACKSEMLSLLHSWSSSRLGREDSNYELLITVKTEAEKRSAEKARTGGNCSNIRLVGPMEKEERMDLLRKSSFYLTTSEQGLLISNIIEKMGQGLIPIIRATPGLKDVFDQDLAIRIGNGPAGLVKNFDRIGFFDSEYILHLQSRAVNYVREYYSASRVAAVQYHCYKQLLENKKRIFQFSTAEELQVKKLRP